ncbi:MAG TPA: hypothetical protein VKA66_11490 [Mycobacterium sp.]|nr:hypothetical protein [Mycobacterium sp.]
MQGGHRPAAREPGDARRPIAQKAPPAQRHTASLHRCASPVRAQRHGETRGGPWGRLGSHCVGRDRRGHGRCPLRRGSIGTVEAPQRRRPRRKADQPAPDDAPQARGAVGWGADTGTPAPGDDRAGPRAPLRVHGPCRRRGPEPGPEARTATSDRGAGSLGFAGAAAGTGAAEAAGLITLTDDGWNGAPMLPSSWGDESPNKVV